jgi:hypothetical protein
MRKFIFLSFCLLSVTIYGQIINKKYTWNDLEIERTTCKSPACQNNAIYITHSYHIGTDTVINSKIYTALIDTIYEYLGQHGNIAGFIREDLGIKKTYFLPKYTQDEILLYDFSLALGDVINLKLFGDLDYDFTVTNIDSIVYMGQKRLKITLFSKYTWFDWIEGIGSIQGFLYANYFEGTLLCLTSNSGLLYKNDAGYDDCIITLLDNINDEPIQNEVKIYPNPASDYIRIEKDKTIVSIKILDLYGHILSQYKPDQKSFVVPLSNMDKGFYLINIDSAIKKLIVK